MRKCAILTVFTSLIFIWIILFIKLSDKTLKKNAPAAGIPRTSFVYKNTTLKRNKIDTAAKNIEQIKNVVGLSNRYFKTTPALFVKSNQTSKMQVLNETMKSTTQAIKEGYILCQTKHYIPERALQLEFLYFKDSFSIEREPVKSWISLDVTRQFCGAKIKIFDNRFALLHEVVLDNSKRLDTDHQPKGGEPLIKALGQEEKDEFFNYAKGFWKIQCESVSSLIVSKFPWVPYLEISDTKYEINETTDEVIVETKFTLAVTREDYCNLHNFLRQMYNAFLMMMIFKKQPQDMSVLFLDAHPSGVLDQPWRDIFGAETRAGTLSRPVLYKNLIWGLKESDGGLTDFNSKYLAYSEEFRSYFLNKNSINDSRTIDCNQITITLILRRDKVFHPRNEEGIIGRKIFNEAEIIGDLMKTFPNACVQGVLLDSLPFQNQLQVVSTTDILVGMHGAGMSHSLFLPKHAAILELFPKDFKTARPWYLCYEKIAEWRGLKYDSWENFDDSIEMPHGYTIIPRNITLEKVKQLRNSLCHAVP